jgi:hypothetical protein
MVERFTVLPDERFAPLHGALEERVRLSASILSGGTFTDFLDPVMRETIAAAFRSAGGDEGTVWLLDEGREHLVAAFNSGPNADAFVGKFRQSLQAGMISLVCASEQPLCENEVFNSSRQDKTLDHRLGLRTCSMVAVPLYFARELRGVISCVQLRRVDELESTPGFTMASVAALQLSAGVLSRLIDHRLVALSVGWER